MSKSHTPIATSEYAEAYGAALKAWKTDLSLDVACSEFARAAHAVADIEGARFLLLDAHFYVYLILNIQAGIAGDDSFAGAKKVAADRVLALLQNDDIFNRRSGFDFIRPGAEASCWNLFVSRFPDRSITSPIEIVLYIMADADPTIGQAAFETALCVIHHIIEHKRELHHPPPLMFTLYTANGDLWSGKKFEIMENDLMIKALNKRLGVRYPSGDVPYIISKWPKQYTRWLIMRLKRTRNMRFTKTDKKRDDEMYEEAEQMMTRLRMHNDARTM
jgi:hypothetical protein